MTKRKQPTVATFERRLRDLERRVEDLEWLEEARRKKHHRLLRELDRKLA